MKNKIKPSLLYDFIFSVMYQSALEPGRESIHW